MAIPKVQTVKELLQENRETLIEDARGKFVRGLLAKAEHDKNSLSFRQVRSLTDAFSQGYSEALDFWIENAP